VRLAVAAASDDGYRRLLARFIDVYATRLFNPHSGEQAIARPDNRLEILMVFQGLTEAPTAVWQPLLDFIAANRADYRGYTLSVSAAPARRFWDADFHRRYGPQSVVFDSRPGASPGDFYWAGGDADQAGAFWHAFTSAWLPASLLAPQNRQRLVDAWFAGSRHWGIALALNKGLAGAPPAAIEAARNTAMNPDVVDAFAWAVTAANGPPDLPGFPALDPAAASARRASVRSAMAALRAVAPDTGTYVNECDYFQAACQKSFWGSNYPRLLEIKRRYDPDGLFFAHHGVGSEEWSPDGFTRSQ
jgi:hypothetical protein